MSDVIEKNAGITNRPRGRAAPSVLPTAIVAVLGASSPAMATPRPFRVSTFKVEAANTEWRTPRVTAPAIPRLVDEVAAAPLAESVAGDLVQSLTLAEAARKALPVDEAMDSAVARAFARRSEGHVPRKLTRK